MVGEPERAFTALSCGRRRRGRALFSAEVGGLAGRAIIPTEPASKKARCPESSVQARVGEPQKRRGRGERKGAG